MNRLLIIVLLFAYALQGEAEKPFVQIRHLTNQTGLTSNRVNVLEQDSHGYIWAGTPNGLNRIGGHEVYTWSDPRHPLHGIHVNGLEMDEAENALWIFTTQGMKGCFDLEKNQLIPYTPDKADSLLSLYHKGHIYMWQYGSNAQQCKRFRLNKGTLNVETFKQTVTDICTDEEGNDWLLTTHGLYLNGFEERLPGSDSVIHIATFSNLCLALTSREIIVYNHSRRVARRTAFPHNYRNASQCTDLATWRQQLLIFTPERTITYEILDGTFSAPSNLQIQNGQVLPESQKSIYVHDGKGKILRFGQDGGTNTLRLMPTEMAQNSGKRLPQVSILNATIEAFATYGNGLHILHTGTGKSTHIRQEDTEKLIADNRIHDLLTDRTGCLWIATDQAGVICLQSNNTEEKTDMRLTTPTVRIPFITIDGEECLVSNDEMGLSYTHNNVTWHFSCTDYDRMNDIRYQYYLTGHDSTWQVAKHSHKAIYKELRPGRYTFHVKASLDGEHWGAESTHTIIIADPWWTQWPAMLALLTLFAMMGLFLYLIIYKVVHPERATDKKQSAEYPSSEILGAKSESHKKEGAESTEEKGETALTAKDQRFKQLLFTLMEEHIEEPGFAVEEFAACANLKRTQFYTKVKRITGLTPIELLRKAHLEHAAKLLIETDLNIDEVRERCGFSNSTTFYGYFKQQYGMTPRQYRQSTPPKA